MQTERTVGSWDFGPVYDLLQNLSQTDSSATRDEVNRVLVRSPNVTDDDRNENNSLVNNKNEVSLGDFSRLWNYLGVQNNEAKPSVPVFEASTAATKKLKDAYTSDGALYYPPSSRSVRWKDESGNHDSAETQLDTSPNETHLTKNQRKKRNRKLRKALEEKHKSLSLTQNESTDLLDQSESTEAISKSSKKNKMKSENSKQSSSDKANSMRDGVPDPQSLLSVAGQSANFENARSIYGSNTILSNRNQAASKEGLSEENKETLSSAKQHLRSSSDMIKPSIGRIVPSTPSQVANIRARAQAVLDGASGYPGNVFQTPTRPPTSTIHESLKKQQQPQSSVWDSDHVSRVKTDPRKTNIAKPINLHPPSYQKSLSSYPIIATPSKAGIKSTKKPGSALKDAETFNSSPRVHSSGILEMGNPKDTRNWTMLLKLLHHFPQDHGTLLSPLQLSINRPQPTGIHVFIDASNILIGYHDYLKHELKLPNMETGTMFYPDFQALALLLERRRPISKRVLAGSTPELDGFERAREVGYETCILDKVFKARELTSRQRYFALRDRRRADGYLASGDESGAESDALPPQRPKWVEQGVDEILHLKMLESIVDTPRPNPVGDNSSQGSPPVMILATGDAAEAEYSAGFMKMVERALTNGWSVEIAAWRASVSQGYRKLAQKERLKGRFKIIELDHFAEELFLET